MEGPAQHVAYRHALLARPGKQVRQVRQGLAAPPIISTPGTRPLAWSA
jgi:hypothetical protein